jgi:hypothetical protein
MILQERVERETQAAFGEPAGAAMTSRATIRKQLGCRFTLIEILSLGRSAGQSIDYAESKPMQFGLRYVVR